MKSFDAQTTAYIGGRTDVIARHLLWIEATNRDTGATENMGLWTGLDTTTFNIGGLNRIYYGAGAILGISSIAAGLGTDVRRLQVSLNELTPEVAQLLRGYDARLAPVEIHRALLDTTTRALVAPPVRVFRGWVDDASIDDNADGKHSANVRLASDAMRLTRATQLYRSDQAMRQRSTGDIFRRFVQIGGRVPIFWGPNLEEAKGNRG